MNIEQLYNEVWLREGFIDTDERKAEYFEKTKQFPSIQIDNIVHMGFIFPSIEGDYALSVKGMIAEVTE